MYLSYNWLKEFVKLNKTPKELADALTLSLSEIESLKQVEDDFVLEIENKALTNRPDCFCHLGIARELGAFFEISLNDPTQKIPEKLLKPKSELPLQVEIANPDLCYRYTAIVLDKIKVEPSPKWLIKRLEACNQRSINNVVDITNYIMLSLGQPLHAFDYEKIKDHKIIVRTAKNNERIITLDQIERKLNSEILLIADPEKGIGIAGIMGGANTEVTEKTKTIVLESANFNNLNNRRTTKFLNLRTEASTRFEKNQDPHLTYPALIEAVKLLQKYANAQIVSKIVDTKSNIRTSKIIRIDTNWINQFLGLSLPNKQIISILKSLQFSVQEKKNQLEVTVPSFRNDINMKADLAEEIARIYGYDKIPITIPYTETEPPFDNPSLAFEQKTKISLEGLGFTEIFTYAFIGDHLLSKANSNSKNHLKLINPLTPERTYFGQSLVPNMLEAIEKNIRNFDHFRLFELQRVYFPNEKKNSLPFEPKRLTGALIGDNYQVAKGLLEVLFEKLNVQDVIFTPIDNQPSYFEKNIVAEIKQKEKHLGYLGKIDSQINISFDIDKKIYVFDLDLEALRTSATITTQNQPIPKYPAISYDLSIFVNNHTYAQDILDESRKAGGKLLEKVEIFDIYEDAQKFGSEVKNISLRLIYRNPNKTLKEEEAKSVQEKIIKTLDKKFEAKIRK